MEEKRVKDSRVEQVYVVRAQHINADNRLFGGYLMQWIDEVAGVVCRRHSKGAVTAIAIDNLQFKKGAFANDTVVVVGQISYVGTTSMEVRVDTYIEDFEGHRESINQAYVVMVAIDENGRPRKVPTLKLETEEEKKEWEAGARRWALRKQRREEVF